MAQVGRCRKQAHQVASANPALSAPTRGAFFDRCAGRPYGIGRRPIPACARTYCRLLQLKHDVFYEVSDYFFRCWLQDRSTSGMRGLIAAV